MRERPPSTTAPPEMLTLADRMEAAAGRAGAGAITFVVGGAEDVVPYRTLLDDARGVAAGLQRLGVNPGDHVALLGSTTRSFVTAIEAVWLCGATLVVLPLPMRLGSIEEFAAATRERVVASDVSLVVVDADLAPFIEVGPDDAPMVTLAEIDGDAADFRRPAYDPDALAVLQFTSGSTAEPKGVMLPNRTVCANLDAVTEAAGLDPATDVLVSWLPLYHDMGLVGFLILPLTTGTPLVLGAPQDFLAAPVRWMEWLSTYRGTATAGPNFSYVLATRALRNASGLDLSSLRIALNGAEPVDPDAVEAFVAEASRHGMDPGAVFPAFGMAEVMIGGAFPRPGLGLRTDRVNRRVLETERYAAPVDEGTDAQRRLAILGRPLPGLEFRVCDPDSGELRDEREVGELQIRGSSVTPGYFRRPPSEDLFADGDWLRTGDLAYMLGGELVVCGRIKDVIIVAGRNVFPEDVERAVAGVDGVRAGNVVAFGVEGRRGREGLVVVAESKTVDVEACRRTVAERVREAVGLPARDVVMVAAGTLPKTSSGKLQRSLCKERYLGETLVRV
jgi:fatty-acyl-CoA synthase